MTRPAPRPLPHVRIWLGATLLGILLGLIGPYGSYFNSGALLRIGYWTAAIWLGVACFGGAMTWTVRRLPPIRVGPLIAVLVPVILLAGIPHAFATRTLALHLWPVLSSAGPRLLVWYAQGIGIALPVCAAFAATSGWFAGTAKAADTDLLVARPGEPSLLARLPIRLGRDIQCLQMEDHYVRVCTAHGSTLLLMPLAQAIAEMAPAEGLQTHRSWWVARHAVTAIGGTSRAMTLRLANGMDAPVARTAVSRLRVAGWLDDFAQPT